MGIFDSLKKDLFAGEEEPAQNTLESMVHSDSTDAGRARVIVVEPLRMEECNAMVECIRHGLVVVINTENLEAEFARRIVDFLTGATRAIDGRSLRINSVTYIFAPADIDVAIRRKEKREVPVQEPVQTNPVHRVIPDEAVHTVTEGLSARQNFAAVREEPEEPEEVYEPAYAYAGTDADEESDSEDEYEPDEDYGEENDDESGEYGDSLYDEEDAEAAAADYDEAPSAYTNSRSSYGSESMSELSDQFGGRRVTDDTILYGIRKEDVQ
jgi:cell division inhibitor SepF